MSVLFTINFRREAYLKEVARTRRRVVILGVWVAYFGALGLLLGLYGMNCASLAQRSRLIERQTAQLRGAQGASMEWKVQSAEISQVEQFVLSPRAWHDRLVRLSMILPNNVRITGLQVNPQNLSTPAEQNKLVITGQLRPIPGQERMQGVMRIVTAMHEDSVFVHSYLNIRLASSRIPDEPGAPAEFVIECR